MRDRRREKSRHLFFIGGKEGEEGFRDGLFGYLCGRI